MSHTFPAAYSAKLKNYSVDVDWLFHFSNDAPGTMYLASKSRTVGSNYYYGIIEDSGEISKDLDILESKASTASLVISCANSYKNGLLSDELIEGTDNYLNQDVYIYECIDNQTTLANCLLLFEGRLKLVEIQSGACIITIEEKTPFDYIKIPYTQDTGGRGVYMPVVYGDFTPNTDGDFATASVMYPAPLLKSVTYYKYFAVCKAISSNGHAHFYDKNKDQFLPFTDSNESAFTIDGIKAIDIFYDGHRSFSFWPDDVDDADYDNTNDFDNPENAIDGSAATAATDSLVSDDTTNPTGTTELVLMLPQFDDPWSQDDLYILVDCTVEVSTTGSPDSADAYIEVSIDGSTWHEVLNQSGDGSTATDGTGDVGTGNYDSETIDVSAECTNDKYGNKVWLRLRNVVVKDPPDGSDMTSTATVRGLYIRGQLEWYNYPNDSKNFNDVDQVYIGDDGLERDYTDGNGTATNMEIHEAYRDIMDRFAGVDFDNDYQVGWSDLDTDRSGWDVRLWILEPTPIKDVLEQLQKEGCFIYYFKADSDGSGNPGGRWVYIKDSYANGDFPDTDGDPVVQVFDESDYRGLRIYHTGIEDIVTKTVYNYNRHPATDKYQQTATLNNTTQTTKYNIDTLYFDTIDLDYLVNCGDNTNNIYDTGSTDSDDAPNESIAVYMDNLRSDIKFMVECEITNKQKMNIENGDIIQFNDYNVKPYGESWSNLFFMVQSEYRNKKTMSIVAREVYRA